MKVLEFDPMLADVHCGLHAKFWFICLSKGTIAKSDTYVALGCAKPGKWDTEKKCENADQINVGNIIALIEKVQDLVVDDIDMELKQIFINSSFKVFPQRKKKIFIQKLNKLSMVGYDSQCCWSRKEYHKASHTYRRHKNTANFSFMIKKSKKWEKFKKSKKQRASGNPKEHWKVLNSKKGKCQIPFTVNEFYDNFKQLLSDDNN